MPTDQAIQGIRLSPQQLRQWSLFASGRMPQSVCSAEIEGEIAPAVLENAVPAVVKRHEILRTRFCLVHGMKDPLQVVSDEGLVSIQWQDLGSATPQECARKLEQLFEHEVAKPADLEQALLNVTAVRLPQGAMQLVVSVPALVADHRGVEILLQQIAEECAGASGVAAPRGGDPQEVTQYADISETLNECLESPEADAGRVYWKRECGSQFLATPFVGDAHDAATSSMARNPFSVRG